MREILFRGKGIRNGRWYYGSLSGNKTKFIHEYETRIHAPIRPETLGQYTGLTDKNGVKIFEGDIVWFDGSWEEYGGNTFEVVFTNGCFYLGRNPDTVCFLLKAYIEWAEVIGNIYDNPELVK